jgi:hypothetical protein
MDHGFGGFSVQNQFVKKFLILGLLQFFIIMLSIIFQHNVTLLSYINISFYFSAAFLLSSLLVYTIQTGFFDILSKSFNRAFTKGSDKRSWDEIPGLSELVTFSQKPLLFYGTFTGIFMLIALFAYYY